MRAPFLVLTPSGRAVVYACEVLIASDTPVARALSPA